MQPHFTVFLLYILVTIQNPEKLPLCLLMILAFSTKDSVSVTGLRNFVTDGAQSFAVFSVLCFFCRFICVLSVLISFNQAGKLLYHVVLKPTGTQSSIFTAFLVRILTFFSGFVCCIQRERPQIWCIYNITFYFSCVITYTNYILT